MTPMQSIVAWMLSAMTTWQPNTTLTYPIEIVKKHPDVIETSVQMAIRFEEIAQDIGLVVYNPLYVPMNEGEFARAKDAMFALGIASYESGGFRKDVDVLYTLGVNGQDYCLMQVWMPPGEDGMSITSQGWVGKDMKDRVKCFITGTDRMKASWKMCSNLSMSDRLSGYTVGHCVINEPHSRLRADRAIYWMKNNPVPATDQQVMTPQ